MKLVGLTGGIATGKSTVAGMLRDLGVHIIDADAVSRFVVAPGTPGLRQVVDRFGIGVLDESGALDRSALGKIVIADSEAKSALEAITHPLIRERITEQVAARFEAGDLAVVVEAALLVETGAHRLYDALWVVSCSRAHQIERLMKRKGCDEATAIAWIDAQLPLAEKVRHATTVVHNDRDLGSLSESVQTAWSEFMALQPDPD